MTVQRISRVTVYCGSNTGHGDVYMEAAERLGAALAADGLTIVYGGTHKGTMGILADAALKVGGSVHGVITERLRDMGHLHPGLTGHAVLATMGARKARMIEMADAVIAMPGGIGTLEEFMEVWTLNQLGEIAKPLGLYDVASFYQPFMGFIEHMIAEGFLPAAHRRGVVVSAQPKALISGLRQYEAVKVSKWMS